MRFWNCPAILDLIRRSAWLFVVSLLAVLAIVPMAALASPATPSTAQPRLAPPASLPTTWLTPTLNAVGDPLPRIQCPPGYTATIYAEGLTSPDGLAFSPAGVLYVSEETADRVSRIEPNGSVTPVLTGLANPEGLAFDPSGNLYVVEDALAGRLIQMAPGGVTTTLAVSLTYPEGVVWTPSGTLYVTESKIEAGLAFSSTNPNDYQTYVTAISPTLGQVSRILTQSAVISSIFPTAQVELWSYAGITRRANGLLYLTNELGGHEISGVVNVPPFGNIPYTVRSVDGVLSVDPTTIPVTATLTSDLISPEGLRFATGDDFPLYVAEEDSGGGAGRLSRVEANGSVMSFCTGFQDIEDVILDEAGQLYISEDSTGLVIRIESLAPNLVMAKTATPASGSQVEPGDRITYTITVRNTGNGPASQVIISDTLDANVTLVSSSTTTGNLSRPNPVQVTGFDLNTGQAVTLTLAAMVTGDISGTVITNRASVSSDQNSVPQFSNSLTHIISNTASPPPNFSLVKSATPPAGTVVAQGDTMTYTIEVSNSGGPATNVTLTDAIPAGITYVPGSATTSLGTASFDGAQVIINGLPVFPAGASLTVTFRVTVTADLTATLVNTATLASDQTGQQSSNPVSHPVQGQGAASRATYLPLVLKGAE